MARVLIPFGILAALFLAVIGSSFYTIDEGDRGVILRNGAITGTADPGLHFKMPFMDSVQEISVRTQTYEWTNVQAYSRDQQVGTAKLSVTFDVPPAQVLDIYRNYGSVDKLVNRIVAPRVLTVFKSVFGQTTALESTTDQPALILRITDELRRQLGDQVTLVSVQVENVDFSDEFERRNEERASAEVATRTKKQELLTEQVNAEIAQTRALAQANAALAQQKAAAEGSLVQAKADADAAKLRGEASAAAIRARGEALRDNPGLVALTQAERWNGTLPTTMLPGGAVPFLDVAPSR